MSDAIQCVLVSIPLQQEASIPLQQDASIPLQQETQKILSRFLRLTIMGGLLLAVVFAL